MLVILEAPEVRNIGLSFQPCTRDDRTAIANTNPKRPKYPNAEYKGQFCIRNRNSGSGYMLHVLGPFGQKMMRALGSERLVYEKHRPAMRQGSTGLRK